MNYILYFFILINIFGLFLMKKDKSAAKRPNAQRIAEKALFTVALFGGSLGIWIGMYLFRHKTRKPAFKLGIPSIILLQVIAGFYGLLYI
mgnify:CR=1 FL=1